LFESIQTDETAARFRAAALPPLAAVLLTVAYLTVYRLLARIPALLFWSVAAILLLGTVLGAMAIVRAVRRERPRGTALGWFAGAILADLLCARMLLWFTLPWL
jgi:predicted benzoate:H+ symporter BenE